MFEAALTRRYEDVLRSVWRQFAQENQAFVYPRVVLVNAVDHEQPISSRSERVNQHVLVKWCPAPWVLHFGLRCKLRQCCMLPPRRINPKNASSVRSSMIANIFTRQFSFPNARGTRHHDDPLMNHCAALVIWLV
jgi:hypothetical protein